MGYIVRYVLFKVAVKLSNAMLKMARLMVRTAQVLHNTAAWLKGE